MAGLGLELGLEPGLGLVEVVEVEELGLGLEPGLGLGLVEVELELGLVEVELELGLVEVVEMEAYQVVVVEVVKAEYRVVVAGEAKVAHNYQPKTNSGTSPQTTKQA